MEGRTFLEGEFLETVIGIPGSRTEILMLRPPSGGTGLELASFVRPDPGPGVPGAMAHELGLRSVVFEVEDLHEMVDRLGAAGYGLIGGIGEYEQVWRMASIRGPEGIIVSLAQRLDHERVVAPSVLCLASLHRRNPRRLPRSAPARAVKRGG